jgi:hypothetical protein
MSQQTNVDPRLQAGARRRSFFENLPDLVDAAANIIQVIRRPNRKEPRARRNNRNNRG